MAKFTLLLLLLAGSGVRAAEVWVTDFVMVSGTTKVVMSSYHTSKAHALAVMAVAPVVMGPMTVKPEGVPYLMEEAKAKTEKKAKACPKPECNQAH